MPVARKSTDKVLAALAEFDFHSIQGIGVGAPGRVELPTNGLGNRCSFHLSYGAEERPNYLTRISSSRD